MQYFSMVEAADPAVVENFFTSQLLVQLDSWGLTSDQHRVYCHLLAIATSNRVTASIESIRKVCKLGRTTVVRVLSQLIQMKLIARQTSIGKESNFILLPFDQWKKPTSTTGERVSSKVLQLKRSETTSTTDEPVPQTNGLEEDISPPPIGGGDISPPQPVPQTTQVVSGTSTAEERVEQTDLDSKLAAARERGWWDTGTWWDDLGRMRVTVNRFVVSVEEFMSRSLDSFNHFHSNCEAGLAMCREQIARIKKRSLAQSHMKT